MYFRNVFVSSHISCNPYNYLFFDVSNIRISELNDSNDKISNWTMIYNVCVNQNTSYGVIKNQIFLYKKIKYKLASHFLLFQLILLDIIS